MFEELKMSHRVALTVVISMMIWLGYAYFFPPPEPSETDAVGETAGAGETEGAAESGAKPEPEPGEQSGDERPDAPEPSSPEPPEPEAPVTEVITHRVQNELLAIDVDNLASGLITNVEPLSEQFFDEDSGRGIDFLRLGEARTLELGFVASDTDFPWSRKPGQVLRKDERSIEIARHHGEAEVVETLTLLDGYEARYEVVVRNLGQGEQKHRIELITRMGLAASSSRYDIHRALCRVPEDLEDFDFDDVEEENETVKGALSWFALDSKYFVHALVPGAALSQCVVSSDEAGTAMLNTGVGTQATLGPGGEQRYEFGLFLGAKDDSMLSAFPTSESLAQLPTVDMTEAIDWGWFGRLSKFLGSMMLSLLRWFYSLTGIWGVAIIMLTVVIKVTLLPLTIKQYRSMRKMKELQPEMEKVREKYGDDKVKQQQEMQALFQRTGVNPLAGCAPMILQFPVWIALYAMLGAVVDLYHEPFLWLPDMTQPDPFYILPIGMGGLMFIQTRMNPTAGDAQQAKMMQWMMPGIFVVMMLFLPSGLGIYIFANIVLSLIQSFIQLQMKSKDAPGDEAASAGKDAGKDAGKSKGKSK